MVQGVLWVALERREYHITFEEWMESISVGVIWFERFDEISFNYKLFMPKYKLTIQKQFSDYFEIAVEFEEKSKKEAVAKSQIIIKDVAEQYSEGRYIGRLYRKSFLFGWFRALASDITFTNKTR